jgi:ABC-type uncharacterized transport system involved in gliding motility auxiliary subunit
MSNNAPDIPAPIARGRFWRLCARFHAAFSMLLAVALAVLANVLLDMLPPLRRDISDARSYYRLSEKTRKLLGSLDRDVEAVSFFGREQAFHADVRTLLREYEHESARNGHGRFTVRFADPNRDLAEARELKRRFSLAAENMVVFASGRQVKYVSAKDIFDEKKVMRESGAVRSVPLFLGEQAFSSALQSVVRDKVPIVYFLVGHGEGDIADYSRQSGYGALARILRRDNLEVRTLDMGRHGGVPEDASLVIVAGPTRHLAGAEGNAINEWLRRRGRLLLLLHPWIQTGLEELLADWGLRLEADSVYDPSGTITGRELIFAPLPVHEITRPLARFHCVFYGARSVEPLPGHDALAHKVHADKARVTVLARTSERGWAERDPQQTPPRYDADTDRPGPVSLAAAAEKGPVEGMAGEMAPTRIVVFGDALFVSNPALAGPSDDGAGSGGNVDLFMNAVHWLTGEESLIAIAPKVAQTIELGMTRERRNLAFAATVLGTPLLVALVGLLAWWRRRR